VVLHFHLLHEYLGVTTIAFKDDKVYMQGDKVSTGTKCCCGVPCEACVDISKVVAVAVKSGCESTDAQACTITISDEYTLPVTVRISGIVDDDVKFNGTILEPDEYIYADNCNGGHFIGTADSGPGYVDREVNARTFTLTLVDNFGVVSVMNIKVCIDPENTQEVCIPPTTDCPVPPPPMVQCCQRVQECDSTTIAKCVNVRSDVCCKSYSYGTETDCEGSTPPYTSCEAGDASPSNTPPYDCVNGDFAFGAWVTVDDWTTFDPDETDPDLIALYAEADSKVNQSFFVPFTCLGSATETIDLGVGAGADRTTAGTRCDDANWFAEVSVNLCARTASVAVSNDSCWSATDIQINLEDLTALTVPCNLWTGCNCAAFSGSNEGSGGGTVSVDELEP
jgi:hypothetical protein